MKIVNVLEECDKGSYSRRPPPPPPPQSDEEISKSVLARLHCEWTVAGSILERRSRCGGDSVVRRRLHVIESPFRRSPYSRTGWDGVNCVDNL